ncbi:hypothetical protein [Candidatus Nitrosotenuis cloacae]|uniref:Uncharacterized protein n=1 Tax=Candidatus Nitrosotenuis cloacae TaxID=1603555 RepID=A0A3G1B0J3_9ARCH|nr:hypothetical protein [Candidatus Nitrosotenuis cloacae]AJZ75259.1 hypothetical protein SU86_001375 [Candidatus Nitrosotenuis cloacae]
MTTNTSEKAFLILTIIFVLISGNVVLISAQSEKSAVSLRIEFSPPKIEQTEAEHEIGYVWFENKAENLITTSNDITIKLTSSNPEIVSVSDSVIIQAGQEFATFGVNTHGIKGQAKIFASYNDHSNFAEMSIGEQDFTENDLRLVINLAASEMNVDSQMPFSFYLINSEGKITQAPFDIPISMEYEEGLITVEVAEPTIKKGDSYAWGIIQTKDKVGNAFLRATSEKLGFDEAKEIKISSSLPSSLSVDIFPERVPSALKRDIEVLVTLIDSDGLPTLAQEDIKVEFFSDDVSINNQIDRKIKEESIKGIIKKGEFSYRFTPRLDFFKENQTITIGAATKGLGVATDTLETVKPITTNNPLAENKTLAVYALDRIPTKSQSVAVYQMGIMVDKEKEETENGDSTEENTEEKEQEFYPILINENYDSIGSEQRINMISSNDLILQISDLGRITASSSHGTAIIQTGQETGPVYLSSTIKGIGSASTTTEIINTLKQEQTTLFSPTGTNAISFDKTGRFDFFVMSLDQKGRPTLVENEIRYLITPINEILTIEKGKSFAHVNFQGNAIQTESETIAIKTIPIGESADADLEVTSNYAKNPTAQIAMSIPQKKLNSDGEYFGAIQLVDFNGNPIILGNDLQVKLATSELGIIEVQESAIISAGGSYVEFPISPVKDGDVKITATGKGIVGAESDVLVKTLVTKLKISVGSVSEPVTLEQPTQMKIYVDDEEDNSVGGATIRVVSADSTISPEVLTTGDDGSATIQFNAKKSPKMSLQILASAEGYTEDSKAVEFEVAQVVEETKTELPDWVIYGAIAGVIAIGGGIFAFLRNPKKKLQEDEDEIYD